MKVNGVWCGWGLGDDDPKVADIKNYLRRKFSYAKDLNTSTVYDEQLVAVVRDMQGRYGLPVTGIMDYATQVKCGYVKPAPKVKPVIFTVEGHLSNLWAGPCASTASALQQQGVAYWQPVGYDCAALPFNNASGVSELVRLLASTTLPDGTPFPEGTPWGLVSFSQGAMIASEFMMRDVLPESGMLHWRLPSFKRGLAFGNPRRERDKCCAWATNPPKPGTQGIMETLFATSQTVIADKWQEHAARGDMFAENTTDSIGLDKTAIARIVTENSWVGGPSAIFARVMALFAHVPKESYAALVAATQAIIFLASNPNPHYSTVAEPGDMSWMAGVAA